MEVVLTTGAIGRAKQSSRPTNQQPMFYRSDAHSVAQPTVSEHWKQPHTCIQYNTEYESNKVQSAYTSHRWFSRENSLTDITLFLAGSMDFVVLLQLGVSVEPIWTFVTAEKPDSGQLCVAGFQTILRCGRHSGKMVTGVRILMTFLITP